MLNRGRLCKADALAAPYVGAPRNCPKEGCKLSKKIDGFMPLRIREYLFDTQHLTTEQHGAYLLLIMAYWANGGPLENDPERLRAITKMSKFLFKKVWPILENFFTIDGKFLRQKRLDEELEKARKITEKRAEAGATGASKRWQMPENDDSKPIANTMANGCTLTSTYTQTMSTIPSLIPNHIDSNSIQPKEPLPKKLEAPQAASEATPNDLIKQLWDVGSNYLTKNGIDPKLARTMIGKWRKMHGAEKTLLALNSASANCVSDPLPYIQKVLNRRNENERQPFRPSDVFRETYASFNNTESD